MKTPKYEKVHRNEYRDLAEARASIHEFLEKVYKQKRLRSASWSPPEPGSASPAGSQYDVQSSWESWYGVGVSCPEGVARIRRLGPRGWEWQRVTLRLITWNLHGLPPPVRFGIGDNLARVAEEAWRRAPDVLLFQEVWRRSYTARIIGHCQTAGYTPVLAQQGGRSTGGLVTLYHSATWSLGAVKFSPFRCHGSALRVWEGDGISRKGALATVLTNNRDMTSVVVVNTHLQAQHGKRAYAVVRRDQVAELESFVAPLTGGGHLMLLAGDFNTTPSDVLYAVLLERWTDLTAGLRQVCETEGRTGCGTCFDGKTSQKWIDYVFVRRPGPRSVTAEVELIRNKQRDNPYSDHEGVQVDISSESRPSAVRNQNGITA